MLTSTCFLLFFFKQKTAYEMRISDWSSDVCSSDLPVLSLVQFAVAGRLGVLALMCVVAAALAAQLYLLLRDLRFAPRVAFLAEIGRASCRERVCQYV